MDGIDVLFYPFFAACFDVHQEHLNWKVYDFIPKDGIVYLTMHQMPSYVERVVYSWRSH